MWLGRLLVATRVVRRVSDKSGYRLRRELPWPAFSAGAAPRYRSVRTGGAGVVSGREGATALCGCADGFVGAGAARGEDGRGVAEAGPGLGWSSVGQGVRRWGWIFWRRRGGWAAPGGRAAWQMELPLAREEALAQVRVVRNDFRDEGGARVRGPWRWFRKLRRLLDGLALRLAGGTGGEG
ncbi:hypothetical protein [Limisphaera sp. 4302-co]|uniref:hypothetical protein n=1 Tax=Limisphaera sp. 4302-co TaxID=3400417 RepID=UPI003C187D26